MRNILFVDDEAFILDGLKRSLRSQKDKWEMSFVNSGQAAITELKNKKFDVIVSDMKMPGMDGKTLLSHCKNEYPNMIRIVLSGFSEFEEALRVVMMANQFLYKPVNTNVLIEVIERSCDLHLYLDEDSGKKVLSEILNSIKVPPVYLALSNELIDLSTPVNQIAAVVEKDSVLSSQILKILNAGFFDLPYEITNIERAITWMGTQMIKYLTLCCEVFNLFDDVTEIPQIFSVENEKKSAILTANISKLVMTEFDRLEDVYTTAMLHDIGKLLLAKHFKEKYSEILKEAHLQKRPIQSIEKEKLGITHAEVGGRVLELWGLPYPIVEAVCNHHQPSRVRNQSYFSLVGVIHVANILAAEILENTSSDKIDDDYLKNMKVDSRWNRWKESAFEKFKK